MSAYDMSRRATYLFERQLRFDSGLSAFNAHPSHRARRPNCGPPSAQTTFLHAAILACLGGSLNRGFPSRAADWFYARMACIACRLRSSGGVPQGPFPSPRPCPDRAETARTGENGMKFSRKRPPSRGRAFCLRTVSTVSTWRPSAVPLRQQAEPPVAA